MITLQKSKKKIHPILLHKLFFSVLITYFIRLKFINNQMKKKSQNRAFFGNQHAKAELSRNNSFNTECLIDTRFILS